MTIEERIDNAKHVTAKDRKIGLHLCFTKRELQSLLEQVAKEQRGLCARNYELVFEHVIEAEMDSIRNAPSPLKEE